MNSGRGGKGTRRIESRIRFRSGDARGALLKSADAACDAVCSSRNSRGRNRDLSANIGCRCMPLLTSAYQPGIRRNACPTAQRKASPSKVRCRGEYVPYVRTYVHVRASTVTVNGQGLDYNVPCILFMLKNRYAPDQNTICKWGRAIACGMRSVLFWRNARYSIR